MRAAFTGALLLVITLAGCSRAPAPPEPDVVPTTTPGDSLPPEPVPDVSLDHRPVRILLTDPVNGEHAPVPRNASERFVFRQVYETLVDGGDHGPVRPLLASSWWTDNAGRIWTFELREGAVFSDGTPVTPAAVAAAWSNADWQPGSAGLLLPWSFVSPDSATVDEDGRLRVALTVPIGDRPGLFAHPALAVSRPAEPGRWPLGSGSHSVAAPVSRATFTAMPADTSRASPLHFRVAAGVDPRNLMPNEADLLLVPDRDLLDYASLLTGFTAAPLSADRTYYLVAPHSKHREAGRLSERLRRQFATDAISIGARAVAAADADSCRDLARPDVPSLPGGSGAATGRVAFVLEDREGRRVAERLVALIRAAERGELPPDLADNAALLGRLGGTGGGEAAPAGFGDGRLGTLLGDGAMTFVLGVPAAFPDPCLSAVALMNRLGLPGDIGVPDLLRLRDRAYPLFSTTPVLVSRSGISGWHTAWDGVPVLSEIGWVRQVP